MYTHLHTVEWEFDAASSHDEFAYYHNTVDGRYVCEYKTPLGFEYYMCSDVQVRNSLLGEYIGCYKLNADDMTHVLVKDHDTETEKTLSLNEERYLTDWE